jgi:UDPglucose 6-dehydrogenase
LRGKRLAVLGLAFKGGTDDVRESPAMLLTQTLVQEGCRISAYDPAAKERAREVLNSQIEYADSPYEAARNADALLILTEWDEFATLDWNRIRGELADPIVIDGRNLYDPESMAALGFTYYSVGRPAVSPEAPLQPISATRKRKNA